MHQREVPVIYTIIKVCKQIEYKLIRYVERGFVLWPLLHILICQISILHLLCLRLTLFLSITAKQIISYFCSKHPMIVYQQLSWNDIVH